MYTEAVNSTTESVLVKLGGIEGLADFYLAGGTALALHLGHRESIDLDFFSQKRFDTEKIK